MKKTRVKKDITESISLRVNAEMKRKIFDQLESEGKTFSKWLRIQIESYLEKTKDAKK